VRRISSDEEAKVFEMWFDGYTREYIAKTLGIGEATVSDIIRTLPSSLQMARDIAVANRKHNLTQADALKGLDVVVQLPQ
jgi:DNA-binding NarL/FixJ family response regulator